MKCPACQSELRRILYESVPVFRCLECHGYLLSEKRLEGIRRSPATGIEQLKREVIQEAQPDTLDSVRCPRCGRKMDKRYIEQPAALHVDVCRECRFVWLDGGELGRLQLTNEMTLKGQESRRFRKRLATMTPEEKAEFERNLEALPDEKAEPSILWSMFFGRRHDWFC
ncbi:MAG: zf-TFIIB domain-containing protein [Pirellulales bacterium]|nr:zf-TFIIB domain-containing protein [Pirellulales bacterium]